MPGTRLKNTIHNCHWPIILISRLFSHFTWLSDEFCLPEKNKIKIRWASRLLLQISLLFWLFFLEKMVAFHDTAYGFERKYYKFLTVPIIFLLIYFTNWLGLLCPLWLVNTSLNIRTAYSWKILRCIYPEKLIS